MIYCYVGAHSTVGDREFDRLGQRAEYSDEQARSIIFEKGGAMFIPEPEFTKLFSSPQELDTYGTVGGYPEPPQDFLDRLAKARAIHADLCSQMYQPDVVPSQDEPVNTEIN